MCFFQSMSHSLSHTIYFSSLKEFQLLLTTPPRASLPCPAPLLPHCNGASRRCSRRLSLQYRSSHCHEGLVYIEIVLRTWFVILYPVLFRQAGPLRRSHFSPRHQVALVTYQTLLYCYVRILCYLTHPMIYMRKWLPICYIVYEQYTLSTPEVWPCYGLEPLLPSSVPDLQPDPLTIYINKFILVVNSLYSSRYMLARWAHRQ